MAIARSNSASASSAFPDRASTWPRVVAASASALLVAAAAFGDASLSDDGDNEPRSKEQPPSTIAINAAGTKARRAGRKIPQRIWGTGLAIMRATLARLTQDC